MANREELIHACRQQNVKYLTSWKGHTATKIMQKATMRLSSLPVLKECCTRFRHPNYGIIFTQYHTNGTIYITLCLSINFFSPQKWTAFFYNAYKEGSLP